MAFLSKADIAELDISKFKANKVSGEVLLDIPLEDLLTELSISSLITKSKINKALKPLIGFFIACFAFHFIDSNL